ncbi:MAG: OmpA family protein [Cytophagaceae bacterium]|nr:OmpA family protein [Gemmatimonadaceae bacterium]
MADDFAVAPTDVAAERNQIRRPLKPFASWQLDDAHFAFDSSVLLPSMTPELVSLIGLVRASPGAKLSVFGHADTTGNDEYNKVLSGRRALALFALLTRRVDLWEFLFTNPHGGDDWRKSDNFALRLMRDAVEDKTGALPRTALFEKFMTLLAKDASGAPFGLPKTSFLGKGADAKGKADVQGCGEFNPLLMFSKAEQQALSAANKKTERDKVQEVNRRVTVFFFPADTQVTVSTWPCPRALEGTTDCRKRFWSDHVQRRTFGERRREQPTAEDTFACRFYDRLARETADPGNIEATLFHAAPPARAPAPPRGRGIRDPGLVAAPTAETKLIAAAQGTRVEIPSRAVKTQGEDEHHEFDLRPALGLISLEATLERGTVPHTTAVGVDLIGLLLPSRAATVLRRTLGFLIPEPPTPTPLFVPEPVPIEFEDLDRPFANPFEPEGPPPEGRDVANG